MESCPLCDNRGYLTAVGGPDHRSYRYCDSCKLIFTEPRFLPSREVEKNRYLSHNNGIQYRGYVNFLNRAIEPALPLLDKGMRGLDFGCGPAPTLSVILGQKGFTCDDYDPFFFPGIPAKDYDFIFATECFEHLFRPAVEIGLITDLLIPGGVLIVMTETWESFPAFAGWYYAKDITHVSFFHTGTFDYIAAEYGFDRLENNNDRVMLMRKR